MGKTYHLSCLLRNLYAGQGATVRIGRGTMNWFQIGKGVHQGCILSPYLFNLYAEYIMRNARLDEAQGGIKIASTLINNLRYAHDTTLMAKGKEEVKRLFLKLQKKSEKWLKTGHSKRNIMASCSITSWQIVAEKMEKSDRLFFFFFLVCNITADGD